MIRANVEDANVLLEVQKNAFSIYREKYGDFDHFRPVRRWKEQGCLLFGGHGLLHCG